METLAKNLQPQYLDSLADQVTDLSHQLPQKEENLTWLLNKASMALNANVYLAFNTNKDDKVEQVINLQTALSAARDLQNRLSQIAVRYKLPAATPLLREYTLIEEQLDDTLTPLELQVSNKYRRKKNQSEIIRK